MDWMFTSSLVKRSAVLTWLRWGILLVLTAGLMGEMVLSLRWRIAHDQAPLFYEAYLMMAEGRLPYRDLFDFQMPGTYLFYFGLGWISRFKDFYIRLLDMGLLLGLSGITFLTWRKVNGKSAWLAALLFGLKYLQGGPSMALQREYLLLLFVAAGVGLAFQEDRKPWHFWFIGICFGLAATIKPHALLGMIPILLNAAFSQAKAQQLSFGKALFKSGAPILAGSLIPISAIALWLGLNGALLPFFEIIRYYWPLYAQINGEMEVLSGSARWLFGLRQLVRLGGHGIWVLPAILGLFQGWSAFSFLPSRRIQLLTLVGLILIYALYPMFSGQFFDYHWLPFLYFIAVLSSWCMLDSRSPAWQGFGLAALVLALVLNVRSPVVILRQLEGKSIAPIGGRVDRMALFLEKRLLPGDTVQPLDWTGGALHAMLLARAPLATPFVFDFYFYHHVSQPYIQLLRARFLEALQTNPPRFIIEVTSEDKPWVSGIDTTRQFPALREFIREKYQVIREEKDYLIYERR